MHSLRKVNVPSKLTIPELPFRSAWNEYEKSVFYYSSWIRYIRSVDTSKDSSGNRIILCENLPRYRFKEFEFANERNSCSARICVEGIIRGQSNWQHAKLHLGAVSKTAQIDNWKLLWSRRCLWLGFNCCCCCWSRTCCTAAATRNC